MIELEKYYSEENWKGFSITFQSVNAPNDLIMSLNDDEELAKVIFGILEKDCNNWLNKNIPALDNLKPLECIEEEHLLKRLKVCLTRIPL
ncbi:hypothetical protein [Flavobacterium lacisediminis]|uniref:Antitoxin Xre/MbcA/ParS-like toxin-binding domain-containing protein n=1 Tax=Flavobacterium lacisediminis TaxID=2989705 RepID=A0ABT3EI42_9FLAO|nr:hypothetical protein [Flavobacterium lacisediminis]MCW1148234.1 hypothetical protein [Flavobacterium lacisediminis]